MTALCASDTRLAQTETECRLTMQMENLASYMAGYLLFGVLFSIDLQFLRMRIPGRLWEYIYIR